MTTILRFIFPLTIAASVAGRVFPSDAAEAPGSAADPVVARGKGFEVQKSELDEALVIYDAKVARGGEAPDQPRDAVRSRLLDHVIETKILLLMATSEEKRQAHDSAGQVMDDARKRFATEDDLQSWLKTMGMTAPQYQRRMTEQRACELVIDRELKPLVHLSDDDVKKAYDENPSVFDRPAQVRLRQIWFSTVDPSTQQPLPEERRREKEKLARNVKARLDRGEIFFKLYQEFSDEPWAKQETDGDEPLYVKGQLPPALDAAAFSLGTNHVSGVLESPTGYHILRVSSLQPASRLTLAEVAPRLREFLIDDEVKKRLPEYLQKLRQNAGVEILRADPPASSAASPGAHAN